MIHGIQCAGIDALGNDDLAGRGRGGDRMVERRRHGERDQGQDSDPGHGLSSTILVSPERRRAARGRQPGAYLLSDMSKALMRSSLRAFQLSRLLAPYRSSCWYSGTAGISSTQSLLMR